MLRFQNSPDGIFTAILEGSINLMIDQIKEIKSVGQNREEEKYEFESLLPFAGKVFNYETALKTLKRLLICHRRPGLYSLNDYHYLLLYDTLFYFCEIHNDMIRTALNLQEMEESSMIGGVHIERINFDDLIAMFFFDTDFLLDAETVIKLGLDKREILGVHGETFGISQGLAPHPEELELKPDDKDEYEMTERPKFWSRSSKVYPDMKASDE